jgi:hypothetical protein
MLDIRIKTVPHSKQRYDTIGDWQLGPKGHIDISVSDLGDRYKESLVAIHEFVEAILCDYHGISQEAVDNFDLEYEARRHPNDSTSEPGDSFQSPYKKEHRFAENIERQLCHEFRIDWSDYEKTIYSL